MISVIIPTYKSLHALDLCLESVIKGQQNKNQIIVVVDGFYDINKDVLEKWSEHIEILNFEHNVGACKAINLGVYNSQYDKVLVVNDDNVFPKNWDTILEEVYQPNSLITPNQIEPTPSIFKQFKINNLGRDPKSFNLENFWEYASSISEPLVEESGSTFPFLISKMDYLRVGGFDESYPSQAGFVSDWDFFLKCHISGIKTLRTYNCHFYHFVSLTVKSDEQIQESNQCEADCYEYAKYKWGSYIYSHPETNTKFIL